MEKAKKKFKVYTWSAVTKNNPMFCHWSEGLKMMIVKDGVKIELNSHEIQMLVKSLPRTVGGKY